MAWIKPTGNVPGNWYDPTLAYDNDILTKAWNFVSPETWSDFIQFTHASIACDKIRFYAGIDKPQVTVYVSIDAYYDSAWHEVYVGVFVYDNWVEKSLPSAHIITAIRFRFFNTLPAEGGSTYDIYVYIYEVDFNEYTLSTVTTQAVTGITHNTATSNGNITAIGDGNPTKRGVCYNTTGSPTVADSKVEETGSFGVGAFTEALTGLSFATQYFVRMYVYNSDIYSYGGEVTFTTLNVAPTVTIQAPTDILATTATANGNITVLGGENSTVRGFKYGLTKTDTWSASDSGSFGLGAFIKGLTSLSPNTEYWIRAYATNSIGTGYSEWILFQTAASGIIPTGTNLFICGDYSGYTYQLMRAETDDGETYIGYFVLTTDLANKSGLSYYKRILDIDLYLKSESAGTIEIYVKRDSEASWVSLGSVSLIGAEEIIIKHLAVDIRAKHFLFKISATNAFRFLGVLFEYLPEDMR